MGFDIDKYIQKALECKQLDKLVIRVITQKAVEILRKEENIRHLRAPVSVVGDLHGQFYDLLELFKVGGLPPNASYLFLGDFVDRGKHSVELITLLILFKIKYPQRVTLIRGNHETRRTQMDYGFYTECNQKYGTPDVWNYFNEVFDFLPISAVVDDSIFCVHGGLSP